jgi:type IV pilus assembly protein PilC
VRGEVQAESDGKAIANLAQQGLTVMNVAAKGQRAQGGRTAGGAAEKAGGKKPTMKDVALFTRQLSVMLASGLELAEALSILADVMTKPQMQQIVHEVHVDVTTGVPMSRALEKHPVFGNFLTEMVRTGEATGKLESVLSQVARQIEKNLKLQAQIKKAMMYPTITLVISLGAVIVMMAVVVPQFVQILDGLGAPMPALTKGVIALSDFIRGNLLWLAIVVAVGVYGLQRWRRTPSGEYQWDLLMLKTPVVGSIVQKSALAKFSSSLGFCLEAGLDILGSLDVTQRVLGVKPMERALEEARTKVREGVALSAALAEYPELFPKLVPGIVRVGESSGELDTTLSSIASFYEGEVEELSGNLSSIIEPVMMILLGSLVGTVVVAMMLPMVGAMKALS